MASHAKLSPSAAKRWLNCPGSVTLCENVVESDTQYADEGTACHELCERAIKGEDIEKLIGKKAQIGLIFTKEMVALAKPCVEFVQNYQDATGAQIYTEMKVEIGKSFGLPEGQCFGTSDIVGRSERELLILDYKFGYNEVAVSEIDEAGDEKPNAQLALYARGAGAHPALALGAVERVRLVILQPKCGEPKEKTYSTKDLLHYFQEIHPKMITASKGGALNPGPWCTEAYCKARAVCPAMRDEMLALAQREFANPLTHTPEELADLLNKVEMIEGAASALRAHAMKLDEMGTPIPGWKRVLGDTKRAWLGDEKTTATGLKAMGVDPYEKKLVSPATAQEQIIEILAPAGKGKAKKTAVFEGEEITTKKRAAEVAKDLLKKLAGNPPGRPVLVRSTDERPALPPVFTAEDVKALEAAEVAAVQEID